MKELKNSIAKYIKKPSKEIVAVYGAGIGVLLILFAVLYLTVGRTLTEFVTDTQSFKQWLDSYKDLSAAVFVFIRAFQTVIKIIPAEPLEIASGYAFGTWGGTLLCSLGSFLGSLVIILLSRCLGTKFVKIFINEEQVRELKILSDQKNQRLFLIIFYLIPGTPKDIFTYIAGTMKINLVEFFIITTICRIPSIITSTICGSSIEQKNIKLAVAVFVATAIVSLICGYFYKKYSDKRKNAV
ncbi:MAG: TVP38/TMEM64 family protein [Eubacterium sp.]